MIWKTLDTNSEYEISDTGLVRKIHYQKIFSDKDGYQMTTTTINGKRRNSPVHRLVLHAFDPRENEDKLEVHHKDGNPANNNLENLCWVTHQENISFIDRKNIFPTKQAKKVQQYDLDGNFIAEYKSYGEAERKTGCSSRHIGNVCVGKRKTCGGFVWKQVESSTTISKDKCSETEDNIIYNIEDIV